jgi:hypothetical protein
MVCAALGQAPVTGWFVHPPQSDSVEPALALAGRARQLDGTPMQGAVLQRS